MSNIDVKALAAFEHNGSRRAGDVFTVSDLHGRQLVAKGLCALAEDATGALGAGADKQAETQKAQSQKREPKAQRAAKGAVATSAPPPTGYADSESKAVDVQPGSAAASSPGQPAATDVAASGNPEDTPARRDGAAQSSPLLPPLPSDVPGSGSAVD